MGGSDVLAPGRTGRTRYVRYFVGLRDNVSDKNNNKLYYENVYEFRAGRQRFEPVSFYTGPNTIRLTRT